MLNLRDRNLTGLGLLLCLAASSAAAQTSMFQPLDQSTAARVEPGELARVAQSRAQRFVSLDRPALFAMNPGEEAVITTPGGSTYNIVYDHTDTGYGGGKIWVGHLRDFGRNYTAIVSVFQGRVSGTIDLPGTKLRIEGDEQKALVTDVAANGEHVLEPTIDDIVRPPPNPLADVERELGIAGSATIATAAANAQIDLLFLYSPGLSNKLGGMPGVVTRANALVTLANQIYSNSAMTVTLNLVEVQLLNTGYADSTGTFSNEQTALTSLRTDTSVAALRNLYGADLVTLVRPFVSDICGLAYIPSDFSTSSAQYGYSVVEDGQNGSFFCDNTSMTHELGHNMGSAHDVATTVDNTTSGTPQIDGTPSYNRGYCTGSAGTIMSYTSTSGCSPLQNVFSSPALSCPGGPCGKASNVQYTAFGTSTLATGADSVTAIDANTPSITVWRTGVTKYTPLTSARLVDSRSGQSTTDGLYTGGGALAPGGQIDFWAVGRGGVPMTNVGSIVMTVTATAPTGNGFFTVWPSNTTRPNASNLNFAPGQTISNLVIAKPGSTGYVSIFNSKAGSTQVIVDVGGWFPTASGFSVLTPARLLDTRGGSTTTDGMFQAIGTRVDKTETDLTVLNRGGIPASGVKAVALNVTATGATGAGFVTAWPAGATRPTASNLNYDVGVTIPNIVIAGVGTGGKVALYNSIRTELIADVAGWFSTSSEINLIGPARLIDTRAGSTTIDGLFQGAGALTAGGHVDLTVANRGGVPSSGAGTVVLNVTAVTPTASGFLTVWPTGATRPNAPNVSFSSGQIIPNLVFAQVGSSGKVSIYNSAGSTQVVADVVGWFPASP